MREKIKDIIIKSIISVYRNLTNDNEKQNLNDQSFYEILGYDILITDDFIPKLIEINKNPDMVIYAELDKPIKNNLFIEALNLIGITPYSRSTEETLNNNKKFFNRVDEKINSALCELERPRGSFELIFPKIENIDQYKKYFVHNNEENEGLWDKIKSFK